MLEGALELIALVPPIARLKPFFYRHPPDAGFGLSYMLWD